jgi:Gpi18-like mannosyltransferase
MIMLNGTMFYLGVTIPDKITRGDAAFMWIDGGNNNDGFEIFFISNLKKNFCSIILQLYIYIYSLLKSTASD